MCHPSGKGITGRLCNSGPEIIFNAQKNKAEPVQIEEIFSQYLLSILKTPRDTIRIWKQHIFSDFFILARYGTRSGISGTKFWKGLEWDAHFFFSWAVISGWRFAISSTVIKPLLVQLHRKRPGYLFIPSHAKNQGIDAVLEARLKVLLPIHPNEHRRWSLLQPTLVVACQKPVRTRKVHYICLIGAAKLWNGGTVPVTERYIYPGQNMLKLSLFEW